MMIGDMTHLLPSDCPGWLSCPTESCWLLRHLNPTSPAFLSLHGKKEQKEEEGGKKRTLVKISKL